MTYDATNTTAVKAKAAEMLTTMGTDNAIEWCQSQANAFPKDFDWWDAVQTEIELAPFHEDPNAEELS